MKAACGNLFQSAVIASMFLVFLQAHPVRAQTYYYVGMNQTIPGATTVAVTCDGNSIGAVRYNTGTAAFEGCNGAAWADIRNGATATAAGSTGQVQFNSGGLLGASANFVWDNTNGRLGIGTPTPGTTVEVNGQVTVDSWAAASATTVCKNGNVLSTCSSSIRYKENVTDLGMGLNEVMRMRPVGFKWKGRDENDFGFIAEDMHDINPILNTYEKGRIEGVKYPQLTAVIVNAVKTQQTSIESQQKTIEGLKAENVSLKAELQQTEQTLRDIQNELKATRPSAGSSGQQ